MMSLATVHIKFIWLTTLLLVGKKNILFRDYLREHPDDAQQYESHKLVLAKQCSDTLSYAKSKTEFAHDPANALSKL
jgi:GrpB-like predicted nucleotidyltransferase (UPF0157 family)